jgi:hypothetical protein
MMKLARCSSRLAGIRLAKTAIVIVLGGMLLATNLAAGLGDDQAVLEHFERAVRPILVETCQKCHGSTKQESDLRLDSRARLLRGGVSGPAIVVGDPEKSLLVAAIRYEGDTHMPPKGKLPDAQIDSLAQWIKLGAVWPAEKTAARNINHQAHTHWAFRPVRDPPVPKVSGNSSTNPVDAFVREKLVAQGLAGSPPADRRTLIRRATFDLTGLPPLPEEVAAFESDADPKAYENLIERLLARPQYGEQWGRHWLDVARYSDTKGYVFAREQRFWPHAWVYRDWVVQAFNDDMPYDRFLLLQIAADQAAPEDKKSLAAMGFLTLGRRFLGVQRDIIDDRIDVVTRGTMGLTVGCARCHDHKYDPIPTRDYYSLYGVFQSCTERTVPISEPATKDEAYHAYETEFEKRRAALADALASHRLEQATRNRDRVGDYLAAQLELSRYPEEGFDQVFAKTDLLPNFVRRWQAYLAAAKKNGDPIFTAWHAYASISADEFAAQSTAITQSLLARPAEEDHPLVLQKFANSPPATMAEVAQRYGELFAEIEHRWREMLKVAAAAQEPVPTAIQDDAAAEALRQVLYAGAGPCEVPNESIVNIEYYFDSGSLNSLWKLQNELDNWILQSPASAQHAIVLNDLAKPITPRVFKRGNPANKGEEVPRQFVSAIAGPKQTPFQVGSGRLELAQAIIDPANPLTARVMVNRVWMHHFGAGLVLTPSDFGTRAAPPSHPELLDWLTSRFVAEGWSLKQLQRRIMLSETYQQASGSADSERQAAGASAPIAVTKDPANRLLWRMNERRLTFEELRDALLASTGRLDLSVGGRAGDLFSADFRRRTLYGSIDRQFLPGTLRMFDFANPDLHIPQRTDTTVPQQALFFLNHPLMIGYAQELAASTLGAESDEARVDALYQRAYQRQPTPDQRQAALEFVKLALQDRGSVLPPTVAAWQYGFGTLDEKQQQVASFERLPHFTGAAWQGGPKYPDGKLGWLQLTATGGHPGNDLSHAVIRRWIAPREMQVRVRSTLVHEPSEGSGVRGFVLSSRGGLIVQAAVHHGKAELNAESLELQAGDTLDFIADIGNQLAYNQFLWKATVSPLDQSGVVYDSVNDFQNQGVQRLDAWEQLAQVLLAANEFIFLD